MAVRAAAVDVFFVTILYTVDAGWASLARPTTVDPFLSVALEAIIAADHSTALRIAVTPSSSRVTTGRRHDWAVNRINHIADGIC
jgi:hypothetical protein